MYRFVVLVCGGRNFAAGEWLFKVLDKLHSENEITLIIHGNARGADVLAGAWARKNSVGCQSFPADWGKHGKAAGPIRNQEMLDASTPDLVIAFPGARGTADMKNRAQKAGVKIMEPSF